MVKAEHVNFEYFRRDEEDTVIDMVEAVKDVSLHVKEGEFVAIVGSNGSGKSTLAKLMNALLTPSEGVVLIGGMDTAESDNVWKVRKNAGMVFQNPDNQIIGTVVEEDVAFGPENLGIELDEMLLRVAGSLETVGMTAYRLESPNRLSGGQKQRVAIAGVLAMQPKCIIFDESTAMLDPQGRQEVLQAAYSLNQKKGITILYITHEMDEVIYADRVFVVHNGELVLEENPKGLFAYGEQIKAYGLTVPKITELAIRLNAAGIDISPKVLTIQEFVSEINRLMAYQAVRSVKHHIPVKDDKTKDAIEENREKHREESKENSRKNNKKKDVSQKKPVKEPGEESQAVRDGLVLYQVSYDYAPGTIYSHPVLQDVNLAVGKGEFIGIIGHTGSGKTTLLQHMNGLLAPTGGQIYFEGKDIYEKGYDRTYLRSKVGLVFQYPEQQLFAETVLEDVCFGPRNLGLPLLEVQKRAFDAIKLVGLSDEVYDLSPFELSGGQKRRAAIAGVLAMQPEILILDEPVAGLDPVGRKELLAMLSALHSEGMTIVLVSHNMDETAEYADRVVVMVQGKILYDDMTEEVFLHAKELEQLGLTIPVVTQLMLELRANGYDVDTNLYRIEDVEQELLHFFKNGNQGIIGTL